jgi:mono/diheme cytochrome c family protein
MKQSFQVVVCLLVLVVLAMLPVVSQTRAKTQVERGKYLAIEVAHCGDCHTPMNEKGEPVQAQWLRGAVLSFKPTSPMPWAEQSPNIAGLPGWKEADAVTFLMTGKYLGQSPRPPMPEYHLTKPDAEAVVVYLRSLASTGTIGSARLGQ